MYSWVDAAGSTLRHVYIQYTNLIVCGHVDAGLTLGAGNPYMMWISNSKSANTLFFQRKLNYFTGDNAYCSGVFSDGLHAYMLISTDYFGSWSSVIAYRDIIYDTNHQMKQVNSAVTGGILAHSFVIKSENGVKTMFHGGVASGNLFG